MTRLVMFSFLLPLSLYATASSCPQVFTKKDAESLLKLLSQSGRAKVIKLPNGQKIIQRPGRRAKVTYPDGKVTIFRNEHTVTLFPNNLLISKTDDYLRIEFSADVYNSYAISLYSNGQMIDNPEGRINNQRPTSKTKHPDGSKTFTYPNGQMITLYTDDNLRIQFSNEKVVTVKVSEGVLITQYPSKKTVTEYPNGDRRIEFPSGWSETEFKDGTRLYQDPNGHYSTNERYHKEASASKPDEPAAIHTGALSL